MLRAEDRAKILKHYPQPTHFEIVGSDGKLVPMSKKAVTDVTYVAAHEDHSAGVAYHDRLIARVIYGPGFFGESPVSIIGGVRYSSNGRTEYVSVQASLLPGDQITFNLCVPLFPKVDLELIRILESKL